MELETFWVENLRKYETLAELKKSSFFSDHGRQIERFLKTPQIYTQPGITPRLNSFLRIAQWNIEKGKRFNAILGLLQASEILKWADIIILNEADQGMNRTENRHVALNLAESLGMHMVFGPSFLELTKGTEDDLLLEGENRESLQGNAVLSRYPVIEAIILPLPATFEPYEFQEKRFGWRSCLWARIQLKKDTLWVGSAHLELRNTPVCRARQVSHIMENLPGKRVEPRVLGGDFNTNSFKRGTAWRTTQSVLQLLINSPAKMKRILLHPQFGSEPLFEVLRRYGFCWEGFNSNEETARAAMDSLEEVDFFPAFLLNLIQRRLDAYEGYFCFKLDWLLGNNVRALTTGQKQDPGAGVESLRAARLKGDNFGANRISDHLPHFADLDLSGVSIDPIKSAPQISDNQKPAKSDLRQQGEMTRKKNRTPMLIAIPILIRSR
jgi:endonuclease/exonuclease/phosphatase family metal-dependent hydrolase